MCFTKTSTQRVQGPGLRTHSKNQAPAQLAQLDYVKMKGPRPPQPPLAGEALGSDIDSLSVQSGNLVFFGGGQTETNHVRGPRILSTAPNPQKMMHP